MIVKSYDLLIFDLDGTLIDSADDLIDSINAILQQNELASKPHEEIKSYIGQGLFDLLKKSLNNDILLCTKIYPDFLNYYFAHATHKTHLYPGVFETLQKLSNKKLVIFTNKDHKFTEKIIAELGISNFFSMVLSGDKVLHKKPHPYGIYYTLEKFKISPEKTLIIGDSEHDIKAGNEAGIDSCFVSYGIGKTSNLKPTHYINRIEELLKIVYSNS